MYKVTSIRLHNIVTHVKSEYEFERGKAIIVVGDNKDNSSQKGNGAGKSGLVEGLAIALTGDCIRAASMKELVRRGEEYGQVDLALHNSKTTEHVVISRKIYVKKAQEVTLLVDGLPVVCSDVNEYNKLILEKLGLTKDDLFSFYLITKEYYKPFLTKGDTVKKEIINRFSNADKIDEVIPIIDEEIAEIDKEIRAFEAQVTSNKGKQEVISDQIVAKEKELSEEAINEKVAELEEEFNAKCDKAGQMNDLIESLEKQLNEKQKAFDKTDWKVFDTDILFAEEEGKKIKQQIANKQKEITDAEASYRDLKQKYVDEKDKVNKKREDWRSKLKKVEKEHADLQNKLAGIIECPACEHNFILADKSFDVEEGRKELKDKAVMISNIKENIQTCDKNIAEAEKSEKELNELIAKEMRGLRDSLTQLHDDSTSKIEEVSELKRKQIEEKNKKEEAQLQINRLLRSINDDREAVEKLITEAEEIEKNIEAVREGNSEELDKLNEQLLSYLDKETEWHEKLLNAIDKKTQKEQWYVNFKNFKSYLANKSIKNIEDYVNLYLQQMGTDLSISIEGYRMMASKKLKEEITTQVLRNGFIEGSYGTFSGGERGRIDVCVILAIQQLINLNCPNGGLDLFIADEIFDSIDSLGLEYIINGLQNTSRTILIISQVEVNSLAEYTLVIKKENKVSTICQKSTLELMSERMGLSFGAKDRTSSESQSSQLSEVVKVKKSTNKRLKNSSKN